MDDFLPAVAMGALVAKVIDFLKSLTNQDWNAVVTQAAVWAAGVVVAFLYAATQWADGIVFADIPLSKMNGASLIAIGLGLGSTFSVLFDFKKARDNNDSAKTPPLLGTGDGS